MDPLEHVLSMLSVEGTVSTPLEAGGCWALAFTGRLDVRCETVVAGGCWFATEGPAGWLRASLGPQVGPALRAMHADLAHRWSVAEPAAVAGMSRSTFALRSKAAVGASPLDHLLTLRTYSACRALRETERTVAAIAASVEYGSESAFSVAFKRATGRSPGEYRLRSATRAADLARAS